MADGSLNPRRNPRRQDSESLLRRILEALGPYRLDLVLIGGWVPYLYQKYGGFPRWQVELARTKELDVFVPARLETADRPILATVLEEAGFEPVSGNDGAVWARKGGPDDLIEFFTPHQGTARQIGHPRSIAGQRSISGIALRHLDLLTETTSVLDLGGAREESLTARVASLGGYVLNKATTFPERMSSAAEDGSSKAAKDLIYLRDVMAGGEEVQKCVADDIAALVKRDKGRKTLVRSATENVRHLAMNASLIVDAAVAQNIEQHRFTSESAARNDLLGYLENLAEILGG